VKLLVRLCAALAVFALSSAPAALALGPPSGLDQRGWELVSPLDKNGGEVGAPGTVAAGVQEAATQGAALAFGAASSFGQAEGSLAVNQYVARRSAAGWSTDNITPPALSATYQGGAYQLISEDLSTAVVSGGDRCRAGIVATCQAENPPLGPGGPAGYRNLYLRQSGTYLPLITSSDAPSLSVPPEEFRLFAAGASPDLAHIVVSTCAALTTDAAEVSGVAGCDPDAQNLYEWEAGQLRALNLLPGETATQPGALLPDAPGAVSGNGQRVYFEYHGDLYLRDGDQTVPVAAGATFQAASSDGSRAFYLAAEHLYEFEAGGAGSTDLTPAGGAAALLGTSSDGSVVFYTTSAGLFRRAGGFVTKVAAAIPASLPPTAGRAVSSAVGSRFFFDTSSKLATQDTNAAPDIYEWEADGVGTCTKSGGCLGLISDGRSAGAALIDAGASGGDVFFATRTALVPSDRDLAMDVYDARENGGFPEAAGPDCVGDDCAGPAPAPEFRAPPTLTLTARANPPAKFGKRHPRHHKHHRKRNHHSRHRKGSAGR